MPIGKWLRLKGYELKPNQNRAPPGSSAAYKQKAHIREEPSPPPLPPREVHHSADICDTASNIYHALWQWSDAYVARVISSGYLLNPCNCQRAELESLMLDGRQPWYPSAC